MTTLPEGYRIRRARQRDLARFDDLLCLASPGWKEDGGTRVSALATQLFLNNGRPAKMLPLVAEAPDGSVVGASILVPACMEWAQKLMRGFSEHETAYFAGVVGEISQIAVEEGHRGLGLGRAMVEKLVEYARVAGFKLVMLYYETGNVLAQALYRDVAAERIAPGVEFRFSRRNPDKLTGMHCIGTETMLMFPVDPRLDYEWQKDGRRLMVHNLWPRRESRLVGSR